MGEDGSSGTASEPANEEVESATTEVDAGGTDGGSDESTDPAVEAELEDLQNDEDT